MDTWNEFMCTTQILNAKYGCGRFWTTSCELACSICFIIREPYQKKKHLLWAIMVIFSIKNIIKTLICRKNTKINRGLRKLPFF